MSIKHYSPHTAQASAIYWSHCSEISSEEYEQKTRCHDAEVNTEADRRRCTHRYHTYQFNNSMQYKENNMTNIQTHLEVIKYNQKIILKY